MKAWLSILTLSIALAVALAQATPPNPGPQETPQSTTPTNPQTNTQPDPKTTGSGGTTLTEMKTTTFKGVLVDLSCSSRAAGGATPSPAPAPDQSSTANR